MHRVSRVASASSNFSPLFLPSPPPFLTLPSFLPSVSPLPQPSLHRSRIRMRHGQVRPLLQDPPRLFSLLHHRIPREPPEEITPGQAGHHAHARRLSHYVPKAMSTLAPRILSLEFCPFPPPFPTRSSLDLLTSSSLTSLRPQRLSFLLPLPPPFAFTFTLPSWTRLAPFLFLLLSRPTPFLTPSSFHSLCFDTRAHSSPFYGRLLCLARSDLVYSLGC